jgi:hypothetical protein
MRCVERGSRLRVVLCPASRSCRGRGAGREGRDADPQRAMSNGAAKRHALGSTAATRATATHPQFGGAPKGTNAWEGSEAMAALERRRICDVAFPGTVEEQGPVIYRASSLACLGASARTTPASPPPWTPPR